MALKKARFTLMKKIQNRVRAAGYQKPPRTGDEVQSMQRIGERNHVVRLGDYARDYKVQKRLLEKVRSVPVLDVCENRKRSPPE